MNVEKLQKLYHRELYQNVLPFWIKHSIDREFGGYQTCLDRKGQVFDSDKFIWLQARQVWTFATLYQQSPERTDLLEIALHGAEFLVQYGFDSNHHWYFALDQSGRPLVQPYNIFSDCFACMAFAKLFEVTGEVSYRDLAATTFNQILKRRPNPKGSYEKRISHNRPLQGFSLPMILCNLSLELEKVLEKSLVNELIESGVDQVMKVFYDSEHGLIREHVLEDGQFHDSMDGRLLNPGHALEAMWFILDLAQRLNNQELIERCRQIILRTLDVGWDPQHRGIFYFLDIEGHPPDKLEWDQKLWWVHLEGLIATLMAYRLTGCFQCKSWFERINEYIWTHFPDPEFGEWFGYLNRKGEVLLNLKGGKWKGCFHVPRALNRVLLELDLLQKEDHGT